MKTITIIIYVAIASIAAINSAKAEGYYLGGGFGYNALSLDKSLFEYSMRKSHGGTVNSDVSANVSNFKLLAGIKLNPNYAIELGYFNSSRIAFTYSGKSSSNTVYSGDGEFNYSGFDASLIVRPSVRPIWKNAFINIGLTKYKTDEKYHLNYGGNLDSYRYDFSGTGQMLGAGYDIKLNQFMDLRFNVTKMNNLIGSSQFNAVNYSFVLIENFK
jgi:Outer membrane protein beta-barrel domain